MQAHDAIHPRRQPFVMGRHQRGGSLTANQPDEFSEHGVGGMLVEVPGGFVGKHQRRLVGQSASNGDALLLAARELRRAMLEPLRQAERAACGSAPLTSWGRTTFSSALNSGSR
jgi:hypothetical protein